MIVVGVGRRSLPADLPWDAAGFFLHRYHRARHGVWEHSAPMAEPALTNRETLLGAGAELPGVRFRRLALFRHLLVWDAP